jgi:hypothetical protein
VREAARLVARGHVTFLHAPDPRPDVGGPDRSELTSFEKRQDLRVEPPRHAVPRGGIKRLTIEPSSHESAESKPARLRVDVGPLALIALDSDEEVLCRLLLAVGKLTLRSWPSGSR